MTSTTVAIIITCFILLSILASDIGDEYRRWKHSKPKRYVVTSHSIRKKRRR